MTKAEIQNLKSKYEMPEHDKLENLKLLEKKIGRKAIFQSSKFLVILIMGSVIYSSVGNETMEKWVDKLNSQTWWQITSLFVAAFLVFLFIKWVKKCSKLNDEWSSVKSQLKNEINWGRNRRERELDLIKLKEEGKITMDYR